MLSERCASSAESVYAGQDGDVAQLVEHLLCKQEVAGSSPAVSTRSVVFLVVTAQLTARRTARLNVDAAAAWSGLMGGPVSAAA